MAVKHETMDSHTCIIVRLYHMNYKIQKEITMKRLVRILTVVACFMATFTFVINDVSAATKAR